MVEIKHMSLSLGDRPKRKFVDIYVKDRGEALTVNTDRLIQGSKLWIVETAELYVLNEDGGLWCSALDGAVLK